MLQWRQFNQNRMSFSHQKSTEAFSLLPLVLARDKPNAHCHGAVTGSSATSGRKRKDCPVTDWHLLNLTDKNVVDSHYLFFLFFLNVLSKFCFIDTTCEG